MNIDNKLLRIVGISAFLCVNVQAMVQEYQESIDTKHEMIRFFPQIDKEELALMAITNTQARTMYFVELIYEGMVENNIIKVQNELEWILKRDFDINFKGHLGNTLLHYAVVMHNGDVDNALIPLLIRCGADVDRRNETGSTPLCGAAMLGKVEAAKQLLACGADINVKDNFGWSPLEYAIIIDGTVPIVRLLLETPGINIDQKTVVEALFQRIKRIEHLKKADPKAVKETPALKVLFAHWIASLNEIRCLFGVYFSYIQKDLGKASS